MCRNIYIIFIIFATLDQISSQADPCTSYSTLNEEQRFAGKEFDFSQIALSDDRLDPGWKRIVSDAGEDMPTEAPGTFRCGTWYPIWLNGSLPIDENSQITQPVCVQTYTSECELTWNIDIKRCPGDFLVYNLVSSQMATSAYCFGIDVKCADGQYSETGYSPGCTTDVPPETFTPVVRADLAEGNVLNPAFGPSLEPVFKCSFDDIDGKTYAYNVYWYIDDNSVITHQKVLYGNIDQTFLRPNHWVGTYEMNMVVKCSVRARLNSTSVPGPYYNSAPFEAGVKPENDVYVYEIVEGEQKAVPMIATVPVGCIGSIGPILRQCAHTLKVSQPRYQSNPSDTCTNNIQQEAMVFETQDCGVTFTTSNWNVTSHLNITGYIDNIYNSNDRTGHIRLMSENSATDLSGVWDTVNIPDIQVVVSDKDYAISGRTCSVWNDPVFYTADNNYFVYNGCGEFILYKHKRYPYSVHILMTSCGWSRSCVCGVAIQSHDSLFVVRTCDVIENQFYASGRYYPSISYSVCDNTNMVIEKTSYGYQVTLPIGTIITLSISGRWIPTVSIHPSSLDVEQTEGICGFISQTQDSSDDLIPRGSNNVTDYLQFARSWRVSEGSNEELFSVLPKFQPEGLFLKGYCLCAAQADHNDPIKDFNDVHCNLTEPMIQCKNVKTPLADSLYQECHKDRRRRDLRQFESLNKKRIVGSVTDSDDVIEITPLRYDDNFDPDYLPPEPEWTNGWNEVIARQACVEGFTQMTALDLCQTYAQLNVSFYTESCINDIKIAGSTEYLKYTIWLMEDACKFEISKNESLFQSNGGESILETIQNKLCSSNCNNNGICNRTFCVCHAGYIGPDCSLTLADGPRDLTIPDSGLCSTKMRACQKTNVFGMFYAEKVYCKFQHFTVSESGKQFTSNEYILQAVYKYEYLISCEFPNPRKKRSTSSNAEGYDISLSYNQNNYGDTVSVIIFDEDCYICNSTTVTCVKQESCLATTVSSESDSDGDNESGSKGTKPPLMLIVGGALGGCVFILLATLIVIKCKADKNRRQRRRQSITVNVQCVIGTDGVHMANCNTMPPSATNYPRPYHREKSGVSVSSIAFSDAYDTKVTPPVELFSATKY